mgnify:CR=1 FL=1
MNNASALLQVQGLTFSHPGRPVCLDWSASVGAGATPYRNRTLAELLDVGVPAVIRGNGSEIMSTANTAIKTRGRSDSAITRGRRQ